MHVGDATGEGTAQAAGTSQGQDPATSGANGAAAPAAATPAATSQGASSQDGSGTGGTLSPEELAKALSEARREAAANRKAAAEATKALEELRGKALTDEERKAEELETLRAERKAYETRERELTLSYEVALEAGRRGLDPKLVTRLLDRDRVEWDGTKPKDLGKVLEDLVAEYPVLRPGAQAAGTSSGAPARNTGTPLTREALSKMTPDEINARWSEVQAVLSSR